MFDWIATFRNSVRDMKMQCGIIIFYIICDILNLKVYSFKPKHQSKKVSIYLKRKMHKNIFLNISTHQNQ